MYRLQHLRKKLIPTGYATNLVKYQLYYKCYLNNIYHWAVDNTG